LANFVQVVAIKPYLSESEGVVLDQDMGKKKKDKGFSRIGGGGGETIRHES